MAMTLFELKDAIAKAIADAIGHGMREKCERHADAVLAVVGPQLLAAAEPPAQAAQVDAWKLPPCGECGAKTEAEAETMCICSGDKDDCHGTSIWPDNAPTAEPVAQGEVEGTTPFNQWWDEFRSGHAVNGTMKGLAIAAWQASKTIHATHPHSPDAADSGRVGDDRLHSDSAEDVAQWLYANGHHDAAATVRNQLDVRNTRIRSLEAALAAQGQGEPIAWGVFALGGECDGHLIEHAKTQAEADAIVRDWPVNDNAELRVAPIYTHAAPPASPAGVPVDVKLQAHRYYADTYTNSLNPANADHVFKAFTSGFELALAAQGQAKVYQCPRCATAMQVDHTAKPAPPASPAGVPDEKDAARYRFLRDEQATIIYKRKGHGEWEPLVDTYETSTRYASLDAAVDAAMLAAAPSAAGEE